MTKSNSKKSLTLREQDPFLAREQEKYPEPLPSREHIMAQIESQPLPLADLVALLDITEEEQPLFERRLGAMQRAGQILLNRNRQYGLADKVNLVKCKVSAHKDGFGFGVRLDTEGSDIYLYEKEMRKVFHGDVVLVLPMELDRRGRQEGKIIEVLERKLTHTVGRLDCVGGVWIAKAEDVRIKQDFLIEKDDWAGASVGKIVTLEITVQPDGFRQPMAKIAEVLGNFGDSGMEIEIALRKHALPFVFPDEAVAQAESISQVVTTEQINEAGRVDIRHLNLVTIDGETARDFDDAVYAERLEKGYRLIVAIADVSHYVTALDALDTEAMNRSTSVYFPRRVIPMLPEALSNGICSLNPQVDRLCMVCDMIIGKKGKVKKYQFYPAVMNSKARLTYNEVAAWLTNGSENPLFEEIKTLHDLYQTMLAARAKRGAIEFDSVEMQMIFNDQGKIDTMVPVVRNDAHRLIEECMLAANVCAAGFLAKNGHKTLYRVHEGPTPERLENLRNYLKLYGLTIGGGTAPTALDYAALAAQIHERDDREVMQTMMLRSMQQAVYTPDNKGHFGLAYDAYAHFTSPIRRYPDLLVHRGIKAVLAGKKYKPAQKWKAMGLHCSQNERRADEASRDVDHWLKAYFMQDKIGEVFSGKINAVTGFGVFVLLDNLHIEGLVHITELGKDYFQFNKETQSLVGEKTGLKFKLGDKVTIRVVRASLDDMKIDFAFVPKGTQGHPNSNKLNSNKANPNKSSASKSNRPNPSLVKTHGVKATAPTLAASEVAPASTRRSRRADQAQAQVQAFAEKGTASPATTNTEPQAESASVAPKPKRSRAKPAVSMPAEGQSTESQPAEAKPAASTTPRRRAKAKKTTE
jgi:ribonuclease R